MFASTLHDCVDTFSLAVKLVILEEFGDHSLLLTSFEAGQTLHNADNRPLQINHPLSADLTCGSFLLGDSFC